MATKPITVFFTNAGTPKTGLGPRIDIWNLTDSTLDVSDGLMTEVSAASMPGWYTYNFTSYVFNKNYIFTVNGGVGIFASVCDQYKFGGNESYEEDISSQVWEENAASHTTAGTTGNELNVIRSMLTNRTKLDVYANTLTVYADDCVTPLIVFDLKNSLGAPSVYEVCERKPQFC